MIEVEVPYYLREGRGSKNRFEGIDEVVTILT